MAGSDDTGEQAIYKRPDRRVRSDDPEIDRILRDIDDLRDEERRINRKLEKLMPLEDKMGTGLGINRDALTEFKTLIKEDLKLIRAEQLETNKAIGNIKEQLPELKRSSWIVNTFLVAATGALLAAAWKLVLHG